MHYEIVLFKINVLPSYVSDSLDVFAYKSNGILSRRMHHKYTNMIILKGKLDFCILRLYVIVNGWLLWGRYKLNPVILHGYIIEMFIFLICPQDGSRMSRMSRLSRQR